MGAGIDRAAKLTRVRALQLHTEDGHRLTADLAEPDGDARGAVVLCHPHPLYGGDRFHPVVDALFQALPAAGFRALRFDFRTVHDGGIAERLDVVAALDAVSTRDQPVFVAGYSFGALVALTTDDPRIAGIVAIAPAVTPETPVHLGPALVLAPRHDQFFPPEAIAAIVDEWPATTIELVESADHFLVGAASEVARRTVAWLSELAGDPSGAATTT